MAYALVNTTGDKDYHETVVRLLESLEDRRVKSLAIVAICDDGHSVNWYNSGAMDLKRMAGVLDLAAVRQMIAEDFSDGGDDIEDSD